MKRRRFLTALLGVPLAAEFLKTNGFPLPSIHEQYLAGRMAEPVGFKWYFDEVVPCQVMPNGWAPEEPVLKPGDHFTMTLDGKNYEGNA